MESVRSIPTIYFLLHGCASRLTMPSVRILSASQAENATLFLPKSKNLNPCFQLRKCKYHENEKLSVLTRQDYLGYWINVSFLFLENKNDTLVLSGSSSKRCLKYISSCCCGTTDFRRKVANYKVTSVCIVVLHSCFQGDFVFCCYFRVCFGKSKEETCWHCCLAQSSWDCSNSALCRQSSTDRVR